MALHLLTLATHALESPNSVSTSAVTGPHAPRVPVLLGRALRVEIETPSAPARGPVRVACVVPCHNSPQDVVRLFSDLRACLLELAGSRAIDLRVVFVDNASEPPISAALPPFPPTTDPTTGPKPCAVFEHLRLEANTGGSGGYNAGMRRVLALDATSEDRFADTASDRAWAEFDPEFVWMVDSDARVAPNTLAQLIEVLEGDASIVAAGAALHDPNTGQCFEIGGRVNRANGMYGPVVWGKVGVHGLVECDYVAACCALVRADAIRTLGVMPDRFLNGDDVEWFIRLAQVVSGRVVGVPWARADHPRFDKFPTWHRYYMTRNALAPIAALGLGRLVRARRIAREIARAMQQEMMQRPDLASLHIRALQDFARGQQTGPGVTDPRAGLDRPIALDHLAATLRQNISAASQSVRARIFPAGTLSHTLCESIREQLTTAGCTIETDGVKSTQTAPRAALGFLSRLLLGARADLAVVPSRGRMNTWVRGRWIVQVAPGPGVQGKGGSFVIKRAAPWAALGRTLRTMLRGTAFGLRALRAPLPGPSPLDVDLAAQRALREMTTLTTSRSLSVEAIILTHNRAEALARTLEALTRDPVFMACNPGQTSQANAKRDRRPRITVVDNASAPGTLDEIIARYPDVRVLRCAENLGVEAFNRGVSESTADVVVILDDDAIPAPGSLAIAIDRLSRDRSLGAVTLHPKHPSNSQSEWPFASSALPTDRWPVMGCANIVRPSAWNAVGGYEPAFFLYRNDADLALKLLGAGFGVHFDPALVVWHDSPTGPGAKKSLRWHELATRNWVWMARRHGRGLSGLAGGALGWAWAHRLSGLSIPAHWASLRGGLAGVHTPAPSWPLPTRASAARQGHAWRELLRLRLRGMASRSRR